MNAIGSRGRPLTAMNAGFERLSLLVNINSCELVTFRDRLDHEILKRAIAAALRRHPLTNCRVARGRFNLYWESSAEELPIDIRFVCLDSDDEALVHDHLRDRIWGDTREGEGKRIVRFVLTETPCASYLQLISPHSCTDARSGARLIQDIADCYSDIEAGREPDVTPIDVPDRSSYSLFLAPLGFRRRLAALLHAIFLIFCDVVRPDLGFLFAPRRSGRTDVRINHLGKGVLAALSRTAKERGVSVHALFSLAILRVRERFNVQRGARPGRWMRVLDLATLRPFAQTNVDHLFDTLVIPYSLRMQPTWSDERVLNSVSKALKDLRSGGIYAQMYRMIIYTFLASLGPTRWLCNWVTKAILKTNVLTTNPGKVPYDIERFGSVKVEDFSNFPQLLPPASFSIIYTTFQGSLRLIALYDRDALGDDIDTSLLAALREEVCNIAGFREVLPRSERLARFSPVRGAEPRTALVPGMKGL